MIRSHVLICGGTGCTSSNSVKIKEAMEAEIKAKGLENEVQVIRTGCFGLCALGPIMIVYPEGCFYSEVKVEDVPEIVEEHLLKGRMVKRLLYKETVTPEEIKGVEDEVNNVIASSIPVTCEEMSVEKARAEGAIGVFGDRYGELVKVYTIGTYSKEICGGPHAVNTNELGTFKIQKEQSSSSGVRRIKAVLVK